MTALDIIAPLRPGDDFAAWLVAGNYPDLQSAWDDCPRADWLLWLAERCDGVDRGAAIRAVAAIARDVLPRYEAVFSIDTNPRRAVEIAEAWAADPAIVRTSAASNAAAWIDLASAASDAFAWFTAQADNAAVATGGAWAAHRITVQRQHADIIRGFLPHPPEIL